MDNYFSARDILEKAIGTDSYFQIKSILTSTKAADVAEVIRCRDCKRAYANANDPGVIYCGWSKEPTPPDGFCHRGEREQNGQGGRA